MAQSPPRTTAAAAAGARGKPGDKPGTYFLGRYRVVDEIGIGGMATVHLGRMDGPGGFQKWVAIKRIHPHLVEDDQFVDMFLDEARIAAGINHPNVAQVFDMSRDDNTYWIAMEYLYGEPLREVMRRAEEQRMFVSPELAARIGSDAAEGLHAAHELRGKSGQLLGLVHRDVTPHNLFLTYDGYTKVVDFGIAKVADRLSSTRAGTLKGKLAYMSPEQVRGSEIDRTTDIFALGVVLWELTTNQRLFRMDTDLDTLEKVQACVVPPPSSIVRGYPAELESILMKALAKRKQDRFQTAREFSRALQSFLMRRAAMVGPEEVAQFVRQVFADRIQKREAHLAWAAEVTSTINVDQLRAGKAALPAPEELSLNDLVTDDGAGSAPLRSGERGGRAPMHAEDFSPQEEMSANALMDDDEDVPTTVATKEQVETTGHARVLADRGGPRPAAGLPAQHSAATVALPAYGPGAAPSPYGAAPYGATTTAPYAGAAPAPYGAAAPAPYGAAPAAPAPYGAPNKAPAAFSATVPAFSSGPATRPYPETSGAPDERTAAFPGYADVDDLNATVALPSAIAQKESAAALAGAGGLKPPPYAAGAPGPSPSFGAAAQPPYGTAPQAPYNGQGFGQMQPPGGYGAAPQGQAGPPPGGAFPGFGQPGPRPQGQADTNLSLHRPDAASMWLAQQQAAAAGQQPQRKSTAVLVAVVALTALCVIGIGVLVYFRLTSAAGPAGGIAGEAPGGATAAAPAVPTSAVLPPAPAPAVLPAVASAAAPAPPAAPAAAPTPPVASPAPGPAPVGAGPASTPAGTPAAPSTAAAAPTEQGFLTVVCNPFCDDVIDQGRSLGPSPIIHLAVKPGQHRITLKKGSMTKVISVIVVSGQVTAQRVSMK